MTTLQQLQAAAADANVQAFLAMLRHGEGTSGENGYRTLFGGGLFDSYADHPRQAITRTLGGKPITSTAAGAWQFLARTWDGLVRQYAFPDFTPQSQTLGAIALIAGRGALADVIAGRFDQAVAKCAREWASLPGSPYGQPVITLAKARALYEAAGGRYEAAAVQASAPVPAPPAAALPPVEDRSTYLSPQESTMSPFVLPALSALIDAVPKLAGLFSSGSAVAERNVAAAETVVSIAKSAIAATNEQDLVERLKADPGAVDTVRAAVERNWYEIQQQAEASRASAREFVQAYTRTTEVRTVVGRFTFPELLALIVVLICAIGGIITIAHPATSPDLRATVVTAMLVAGFTSVLGFWFGSSPVEQAAAKKQGVGPQA